MTTEQKITIYTHPWGDVPTGNYKIYVGDNECVDGSIECDQYGKLHVIWANGGHMLLDDIASTTIIRPVSITTARNFASPIGKQMV